MRQRSLILLSSILLLLSACKKNNDHNHFNIAKESYPLPIDTLFPEGIAYNTSTGHFYTGSTTSGDIIQVNVETGAANIWASGKTQGRRAATGLKLDQHNHLWICGGDEGKVSVVDENGTLLKMWDLKSMFGAGFVNDCISDGVYMYFTDSRVQKIYRATIAETPSVIEEWLSFNNEQIPYDPSPTAINANGIEITQDKSYLLVVVSSSGKLYRIALSHKTINEIPLNGSLTSGDGLVLNDRQLYVSRNALNTIVPVNLTVNYDGGSIGAGFGNDLNFNTTMVKVDRYLLTVNGQLNKRATRTQSLPFTVSRVTIP
ncbi:MAG TPA: hypothetical protein VD996_15285 [Chitinophagaceae bacterium]|nr:hypothetical protein [Chitinophagaceae bacterium]